MSDNSVNNKRIAKNTFFLYIRMAIVLFVTIYTSRVVLTSLGVENYGIYNVVAGFVTMFAFLNSSLTACIQRYYNYENSINGLRGFQRVYIMSFYIQLALSIIILFLLETFGVWYLNHKLVIPINRIDSANLLFHTSAASLFFVIIQVPYSAAVMAKEKMNYYAFIGIIDILLKLLVAISLPFIKKDSMEIYGILLLCVTIINFLMYYVYCKLKIEGMSLTTKYDTSLFKEMLSFTSWSVLGSFTQVIKDQGINILLNIFFGPIVNAARAVSFQIKSALVSFMSSIVTASRPQIVESYAAGNNIRAISLFFVISKLSYILLYLMVLPISYEINFVLNLWLGENVPDHTSNFTLIILITALIDILNWPVSIIIYATGKIDKYNILTSGIGLLILPIAYFFLKLGVTAEFVYILSLIISLLVQIVSVILLRSIINIKIADYCLNVLKPCILVTLSTVLIPYIFISIIDEGFLRIVITILCSTISVITATIFWGLNQSEKAFIFEFIKKHKVKKL